MEVRRTVPVKLDVDSDDAALLHETVAEFLWAANHVVGFLLQLSLAGRLVIVLPSVVYDVVSGPQKLVYCLVQKCGVVAVHVEFDRDSSPHQIGRAHV